MADSSSAPIKDAPAPFNKAAANIILRSVDSVDFRVREGILAEASSVFEDMFSLPPLPGLNASRKRTERDDQEYRDDVPVIPVSETAPTLDNLLRFCYPVEKPKMKSATEICDALEASKKYMMEQAEKSIKEQFVEQVEREPLVLYAISACHNWTDEMKIAAKASLGVPLPVGTWVKEMELMGAMAYMRLQVYHQACAAAAAAAVVRLTGDGLLHCPSIVNDSSVWFTCALHYDIPETRSNPFHRVDDGLTGKRPHKKFWIGATSKQVFACLWIVQFLQELRGEVQNRPRGATVSNSALTFRYTTEGTRDCSEPSCSARVSGDIRALRDLLVVAVDTAVSRVQLEVTAA